MMTYSLILLPKRVLRTRPLYTFFLIPCMAASLVSLGVAWWSSPKEEGDATLPRYALTKVLLDWGNALIATACTSFSVFALLKHGLNTATPWAWIAKLSFGDFTFQSLHFVYSIAIACLLFASLWAWLATNLLDEQVKSDPQSVKRQERDTVLAA